MRTCGKQRKKGKGREVRTDHVKLHNNHTTKIEIAESHLGLANGWNTIKETGTILVAHGQVWLRNGVSHEEEQVSSPCCICNREDKTISLDCTRQRQNISSSSKTIWQRKCYSGNCAMKSYMRLESKP